MRLEELGAELARRVGAAGPWKVRLFPAAVDGDVGWASVEVAHGGGFVPVAIVQDVAGTFPVVTVGGGRLVGHRRVDDGVAEAVRARIDGGLDGAATALDVMAYGLPAVAARVALPGADGGWWRAGARGEWDATSASGVAFDVGGVWDGIVWAGQEADGVVVTVGGAWDARWKIGGRGELEAAFARIADECAAALAARAAWQARPVSVRRIGERLLAALRAAKVARRGWTVEARERFPGASDASVVRRDDLGEHFEALLEERSAGVVIVRAGDVERTVRSDEEWAAAEAALVDGVRTAAGRLRADTLRPGARYRVLRAFKGAAAGARLTFDGVEHYPKDGGSRWRFGGGVELWDVSDADCEILRALHEYLALDSGG